MDLTAAYLSCEQHARAHYENFPVASVLLPRRMRPHVAAVYAFARAADDFADEGTRSTNERIRLLDGWQARLHDAVLSQASGPAARPGEPDDAPLIFLAVGASIREKRLPRSLFDDLLSAFRQDVTTTRYANWTDLLDYCRRSANPIGRLVLRIAGYHSEQLDRWSDAICTALQLTNFWQDLGVDFARGRIYVPTEQMQTSRASEDDLGLPAASPEWRHALNAVTRRTRVLFDEGRPVCDAVSGRLRHELRATWLGGRRILDRLEAGGYDPLAHRPRLGLGDAAWLAAGLLCWRTRPGAQRG